MNRKDIQIGKTYNETYLYWKFLKEGLKSANGSCLWKLGEWQEAPLPLKLCAQGFHCSEKILQALGYVQGEVLAQVEVGGAHLKDTDKYCWQRMRVLRAWIWSQEESVRLAIYAAEQVLSIYEARYPDDVRPRHAIEAAKRYLTELQGEQQVGEARAAVEGARAAVEGAKSRNLLAAVWAAVEGARAAVEGARAAAEGAKSRKLTAAVWAAETALAMGVTAEGEEVRMRVARAAGVVWAAVKAKVKSEDQMESYLFSRIPHLPKIAL